MLAAGLSRRGPRWTILYGVDTTGLLPPRALQWRARYEYDAHKNANLFSTGPLCEPTADIADIQVAFTCDRGQSRVGRQILLRGIGSICGRPRPLVYVDGVRMPNQPYEASSTRPAGSAPSFLESLDPGDIERIEVIRGPAAVTLYGEGACGGVIQVSLKESRRPN